MRDATDADGGRLAERFLAAVRELEVPGVRDGVKVTVSVGVAEALPGESAERGFARGDPLYEAKVDGRNSVAIVADELGDSSRAA